MKVIIILISVLYLSLLINLNGIEVFAQTAKSEQDLLILEQVAENILANTTHDFIIPENGTVVKSVSSSNFKTSVPIRSPYNDWRYRNGARLIKFNAIKPRKDYSEYLTVAASHIQDKQDRLDDKTFVRKDPHNMSLRADDLYMSIVFLSRMGKSTEDVRYYNDAITQIENFKKYLYNPSTQLYYHAWYNME